MPKIYIDSDIILDVFAKRGEFYPVSAKLLSYAEKKRVAAFTTPLAFANIYYVLRRMKSKEYALQSLRKLRILVNVLSLDQKHTDQALNSHFTDFEDALQYYSARSKKLDYIITRNKKDCKHSAIIVCTPEEFLAILDSKKQ